MARLIRPLRQWPMLQQHHHSSCCSLATTNHIHTLSSSSSPLLTLTNKTATATRHHHRVSFGTPPSSQPHRNVHHLTRGLRLPSAPAPSDFRDDDNDEDETSGSDSDTKKSRNQKKREAKRAVRWGMELASFSSPQIKRILKAASLEREVFEAIMLLKRLRPDVREGKRRQFNYIGKLLRGVEPELMDTLIRATKDGDHSILQALVGTGTSVNGDDYDDEEFEETDHEEDEGSSEYINVATKWFDGLINRDIEIINEVYAVNTVDYDRQELRKLVRNVHAVQERLVVTEEEDEGKVNAAMTNAKKSLTLFLRALAKQMPSE